MGTRAAAGRRTNNAREMAMNENPATMQTWTAYNGGGASAPRREKSKGGTHPRKNERTPPHEHSVGMGVEERPEYRRADEHGEPDDGEREAHPRASRAVIRVSRTRARKGSLGLAKPSQRTGTTGRTRVR